MHETVAIEAEQSRRYPGVRVHRDGEAIVVHIPVRFRRRKGRQMILTAGDPVANASPECEGNQKLIEAIAKAHRWQRQLEAGEYAGINDLAQRLGVDRTYVGRILRLTTLAPDIIEAILQGNEPDGISLEKLRKKLPVLWEAQRERWLRR